MWERASGRNADIGVCSPASPESSRGRSWVNVEVTLPAVKGYFSLYPGQHWLVATGQFIKPICQLWTKNTCEDRGASWLHVTKVPCLEEFSAPCVSNVYPPVFKTWASILNVQLGCFISESHSLHGAGWGPGNGLWFHQSFWHQKSNNSSFPEGS